MNTPYSEQLSAEEVFTEKSFAGTTQGHAQGTLHSVAWTPARAETMERICWPWAALNSIGCAGASTVTHQPMMAYTLPRARRRLV